MKTETAFWDSSAIVPVCCVQDFGLPARRAYRQFKKPIIWWGTSVEMQSAIRKLNQVGFLTKKQTLGALRLWENFKTNSSSVNLYERTILLAEDLPERYGLRALDSLQLAAALVWCKEKPKKRPFICSDKRLADAASDAGFDVISLI